MLSERKQTFIEGLRALQAIKTGTFVLKSGVTSPIYIDLRPLISAPALLKLLADLLWEEVRSLSFARICGVPYTALPMATALSLARDLPMLFCRKEVKNYGTKKRVEGHFDKGERCLLIEDVVTSGSSVVETADALRAEGLVVEDVAVVIDREQGAKERLHSEGLRLHSLFSLEGLIA